MLSISVMIFGLFAAISFFPTSTGLFAVMDACYVIGAVYVLVWDLRYAWKHGFGALDQRIWKH